MNQRSLPFYTKNFSFLSYVGKTLLGLHLLQISEKEKALF
ncbi:hypothetical protein FH5_00015 [Priestia endophytica]|nr:hypothetical protein FH5_00015 [Priestia endophytica]